MLSRLKTQMTLKGAMVGIILCMFMLIPAISHAIPQGGDVVGGTASISTPNASTMNITQTTNKVIINWQGFSIDVNELVEFIQPGSSAVALNRVVGVDPSLILGQLVANGNVFLINPNGILFGPDATIDVAGLLATTLNISDSDFMSGNYNFFQDQEKALSYIINEGKIVINDNGFAVLVAPLVSNEGLIIANLGQVKIGAAEQFTVNFDGEGLINFVISNPSGQTPGTVLIPTSQITDIIKEVVNTTEIIEAGQVVEEDGVIKLVGAGGTAINTGTIQADGASGQNAGSIEINSTQATVLTKDTLLTASGSGENSSGGDVMILSDGNTVFIDGALIEAKGGDISGDGGFIEISGAGKIYVGGLVDTRATNGVTGMLFLDPTDIAIGDAATGGDISLVGGIWSSNGSVGSSFLNIGALNASLLASNITVTTASGAVAPAGGDITVFSLLSTPVTNSGSGYGLTLRADEDITIITAINLTAGAGGSGDLTLRAGQSGVINTGGITAVGAITANNLIAVADTSIIMTNLTVNSMDLTTNQVGVIQATNTQAATVTASTVNQAITITANTGNLAINTVNAGTAQVNLTATSGSITDNTVAETANITGGTITLNTSTGIGAAGVGDIETAGTAINATNATGNIYIANNTAAPSTATLQITGTGDIDFDQTGGGALTVFSALTNDGSIDISTAGAGLTATLVQAGGAARNIILTTTGSGNVTVGDVTAEGDQTTITAAGSILDDTDNGTTNITANTISLTAGTDIGGGGGGGAIPLGYLDIDVAAGSGGTLNLAWTGGTAGKNLYLNFVGAAVLSSSMPAIPADLGNIGLGVTGFDFTFDNGTFGNALNSWNLTVYANNIGLTYDNAAGYEIQTTGDVSLTAATGTITDTGDVNQAIDIIANNLTLSSASGIGTAGPPATNSLEIDATSLSAQVTGPGIIYIRDLAGGLTVTSATTNNGNIEIEASGNSAGAIDLTVGTITAGAGGADTATLTAANAGAGGASILDDNNDLTMITASTINLTAKTAIGSNTLIVGPIPEGYLDINVAPGMPTLNIGGTLTSLYLNFIGGNMQSSQFGGILPGGLTDIGIGVGSGDFTFDDGTFDGITANLSVYADNIDLNYLAGSDINTTGNVVLTAATGFINDTESGLGEDTFDDIIANDLQMTAETGIEAGGANPFFSIETDVSSLTVTNNVSGNIDIENYSAALQVNGATNSGAGYIYIYNMATPSTMTIAGNVTSQGGDIDLATEDGLTINSGFTISSNGGDIYLDSDYSADGVGAYTQQAGSVVDAVDAGVGDVEIWLSQASTLDDIIGSTVEIFFDGNADIVDNGTTSVQATNFVIDGFGSQLTANGINLNTQVANLQIGQFGASAGNITIANTGALNLVDNGSSRLGAPWGYSIDNPGGSVNITASSPLNVNADVTGLGDVTLTAAGSVALNDHITIAAGINVQSTGGDVYLLAGDDIIQGAGGLISAVGNDIFLTAGTDADAVGAITMSGTVGSGAENVTANAKQSITLSNTDISTLIAHSTVAGNISVPNETDAITLTDIDTANGSITIVAGGAVTATDVQSLTDNDANDISITGTSVQVFDVIAGAGANADVNLTATTGAITENGDGAADVVADVLTATATTGIDLDTTVNSLDASVTGAGSIIIDETDAITLTDVDTANGPITIVAGGAVIATDVQSLTDNDAND
ncbi:MAG: filamentous hemagglutinin N-terminal domain-containing protein, partial [Pseudomonadota bacterium]